MKLVYPAAGLLLVACASGGSSFGNGDDAPIVDPPKDTADEIVDAPPDARPDAPNPDAAIVPPDSPPDACVPVQQEKLVNPVFDLAPQGMGWVDQRDARTNAIPGGPFPIISANPTGVTAHSPPNKAWFGGAAGNQVTPAAPSLTDQMFQDITFPADATNFIVSGFFLVGTNESPFEITAFDTFSIDVIETNGTPIQNVMTASNLTDADNFTPFNRTLAANLAGRTVRLRMISINDDSRHTNFFVDSLSFKATFCP